VCEHDVREERAGLKNEFAAAIDFLEDGIAGDVAGEEVGGDLDAFVLEVGELGKAFDEFGFSEPGEAFEQDVSAGENAGED